MIHRHGSFRLPTSDWWWTFDYRRIIVSILYDACMATAWIAIFEQEYPVGWVNPFSNNQSMHALMAYDFQIWYGRNWESREWKISMYSYCMMPLALFTEKKILFSQECTRHTNPTLLTHSTLLHYSKCRWLVQDRCMQHHHSPTICQDLLIMR